MEITFISNRDPKGRAEMLTVLGECAVPYDLNISKVTFKPLPKKQKPRVVVSELSYANKHKELTVALAMANYTNAALTIQSDTKTLKVSKQRIKESRIYEHGDVSWGPRSFDSLIPELKI